MPTFPRGSHEAPRPPEENSNPTPANDFEFVMSEIAKEQKRNDVKTDRIKALTVLVEKLVAVLMERNTIFADEISAELEALRKASAPVSLKK